MSGSSTNESTKNRLAAFSRQLGDTFRRSQAAPTTQITSAVDTDPTLHTTVDQLMLQGLKAPAPGVASETQHIPLSDVLDSPYQPRKRAIAKKEVAELMASVAAVGQVTPIVVTEARDQPGKFIVHAGHRRCAALRFLGASAVTAVIRADLEEREARKIAVADNIGREDLTAYEQAIALRDYSQAFGVGFEEAGGELGLQPRTAYRLKAVLAASDELQAVIRDQGISAKAANLLVKLELINKRRALRVADEYAAGKISATELEDLARRTSPSKRTAAAGKDLDLKIDDEILTLKARIILAAVTDEQRGRVVDVLGDVLRRLGIARVEASPAERGATP